MNRKKQNLNFEEQRKISNDINLSEQIKILLDIIEFSSINLELEKKSLNNNTITKDKNDVELEGKLNESINRKFQ